MLLIMVIYIIAAAMAPDLIHDEKRPPAMQMQMQSKTYLADIDGIE